MESVLECLGSNDSSGALHISLLMIVLGEQQFVCTERTMPRLSLTVIYRGRPVLGCSTSSPITWKRFHQRDILGRDTGSCVARRRIVLTSCSIPTTRPLSEIDKCLHTPSCIMNIEGKLKFPFSARSGKKCATSRYLGLCLGQRTFEGVSLCVDCIKPPAKHSCYANCGVIHDWSLFQSMVDTTQLTIYCTNTRPSKLCSLTFLLSIVCY